MKIALVFPGQGAQKAGMGKELYKASAAARSIFQRADAALNEPLSDLIFNGPNEDLTLTANAQPSILTVAVAAWSALQEKKDIQPQFTAGHSLGEFSALVATGGLRFEDAVRITRARGQAMQQAVPVGIGAMAAVLGKSDEEIADACRESAQGEIVSPANFNSPGQIVISGHKGAVERASAKLEQQGGKVIPLPVSAPFHCALMAPAARELDAVLKPFDIGHLRCPVVTNVEARPNADASRVKDLLVRQVTSPVLWTNSVQWMVEQGVKTYIELGPGNVLAGLIRRIDRSAETISVSSPSGVDKAVQTLEKLL